MAGLTYATYKTALATLSVVPETDPNWLAILPDTIEYAELRIYRDLDLLQTVTRSYNYNCNGGGMFTNAFPIEDFVTVQSINVATPIGITNPNQGTRTPLLPVNLSFIQYAYPSSTGSGIPKYFAMLDQNTVAFGPWPDDDYMLEITGTYRPETLSETNTTTFISQWLPDLFLMASMIFVSGYQRNFGRQSDDPAMAQSYESQYQALLRGATVEEYRKKFSASGWTSISPSPVATSGRG
jgi:hypothetical protein